MIMGQGQVMKVDNEVYDMDMRQVMGWGMVIVMDWGFDYAKG